MNIFHLFYVFIYIKCRKVVIEINCFLYLNYFLDIFLEMAYHWLYTRSLEISIILIFKVYMSFFIHRTNRGSKKYFYS
jgi:hypothetical protein